MFADARRIVSPAALLALLLVAGGSAARGQEPRSPGPPAPAAQRTVYLLYWPCQQCQSWHWESFVNPSPRDRRLSDLKKTSDVAVHTAAVERSAWEAEADKSKFIPSEPERHQDVEIGRSGHGVPSLMVTPEPLETSVPPSPQAAGEAGVPDGSLVPIQLPGFAAREDEIVTRPEDIQGFAGAAPSMLEAASPPAPSLASGWPVAAPVLPQDVESGAVVPAPLAPQATDAPARPAARRRANPAHPAATPRRTSPPSNPPTPGNLFYIHCGTGGGVVLGPYRLGQAESLAAGIRQGGQPATVEQTP